MQTIFIKIIFFYTFSFSLVLGSSTVGHFPRRLLLPHRRCLRLRHFTNGWANPEICRFHIGTGIRYCINQHDISVWWVSYKKNVYKFNCWEVASALARPMTFWPVLLGYFPAGGEYVKLGKNFERLTTCIWPLSIIFYSVYNNI